MKVEYSNDNVKQQCTNVKAAAKLFGGDKKLVVSLHARINAIENAVSIKDIVLMPQFHFHKLLGNKEGLFAIDVKSRKDKWRIILCPLDENGNEFIPCNIDEIADNVKIIEIEEVSPHYE